MLMRTNDEARMMKVEWRTDHERFAAGIFRISSFGIHSPLVIREFVISRGRMVDDLAGADRAPIFFSSNRRGFALCGLHRSFNLRGNFGAPLFKRGGIEPAAVEN